MHLAGYHLILMKMYLMSLQWTRLIFAVDPDFTYILKLTEFAELSIIISAYTSPLRVLNKVDKACLMESSHHSIYSVNIYIFN